jgi:hypothetical protein
MGRVRNMNCKKKKMRKNIYKKYMQIKRSNFNVEEDLMRKFNVI